MFLVSSQSKEVGTFDGARHDLIHHSGLGTGRISTGLRYRHFNGATGLGT